MLVKRQSKAGIYLLGKEKPCHIPTFSDEIDRKIILQSSVLRTCSCLVTMNK